MSDSGDAVGTTAEVLNVCCGDVYLHDAATGTFASLEGGTPIPATPDSFIAQAFASFKPDFISSGIVDLSDVRFGFPKAAMLRDHPFRPARRSRRVDHIGAVARRRTVRQVVARRRSQARIGVDAHQLGPRHRHRVDARLAVHEQALKVAHGLQANGFVARDAVSTVDP